MDEGQYGSHEGEAGSGIGYINGGVVPVEQQTLTFYGKPLLVVRLRDGRVGAVLRWFCDNLALDFSSQLRRIKRTEEIANDLIDVRIQTEGGDQVMATLILHAVPFWLAGIDSKRVRAAVRPEIQRYKREVVDVLYAWAPDTKTGTDWHIHSSPCRAGYQTPATRR